MRQDPPARLSTTSGETGPPPLSILHIVPRKAGEVRDQGFFLEPLDSGSASGGAGVTAVVSMPRRIHMF